MIMLYNFIDANFSIFRLVDNARKVVEADAANREELVKTSSFFSAITADFQSDEDPVHPLDIIIDAWNQTCREQITGSSTICVATLDNKLNQLSYSNLGDCGLVVMRHIDSETVGYMRERQTPRHLRKHDLRVAYLSQQQLRSFNLPYQLGFSDIPQHTGSFETPLDADTGMTLFIPPRHVCFSSLKLQISIMFCSVLLCSLLFCCSINLCNARRYSINGH